MIDLDKPISKKGKLYTALIEAMFWAFAGVIAYFCFFAQTENNELKQKEHCHCHCKHYIINKNQQ